MAGARATSCSSGSCSSSRSSASTPSPTPHPFAARLLALLLAVPFHAFLALALGTAGEPVAPACIRRSTTSDRRRRCCGRAASCSRSSSAASCSPGGGRQRHGPPPGRSPVTVRTCGEFGGPGPHTHRTFEPRRGAPVRSIAVLSYEEAVAAVTAPGQRYETERIAVNGVELTAFVHVPPSLRDLFETWRARGDTPFLVYEDETLELRRRRGATPTASATPSSTATASSPAIGSPSPCATSPSGSSASPRRSDRRGRRLPQRVVDRGRARLRPRGLRRDGPARRSGAGRPHPRDVRPPRRSPRSACAAPTGEAGRSPTRTSSCSATRCPTSTSRPTTTPRSSTRRARPGRPKGAVSTHRAVIQALAGFGCRTAVQRARVPRRGEGRRRAAAGVHPDRPAVPRDRWRRGVPLVRGQRRSSS